MGLLDELLSSDVPPSIWESIVNDRRIAKGQEPMQFGPENVNLSQAMPQPAAETAPAAPIAPAQPAATAKLAKPGERQPTIEEMFRDAIDKDSAGGKWGIPILDKYLKDTIGITPVKAIMGTLGVLTAGKMPQAQAWRHVMEMTQLPDKWQQYKQQELDKVMARVVQRANVESQISARGIQAEQHAQITEDRQKKAEALERVRAAMQPGSGMQPDPADLLTLGIAPELKKERPLTADEIKAELPGIDDATATILSKLPGDRQQQALQRLQAQIQKDPIKALETKLSEALTTGNKAEADKIQAVLEQLKAVTTPQRAPSLGIEFDRFAQEMFPGKHPNQLTAKETEAVNARISAEKAIEHKQRLAEATASKAGQPVGEKLLSGYVNKHGLSPLEDKEFQADPDSMTRTALFKKGYRWVPELRMTRMIANRQAISYIDRIEREGLKMFKGIKPGQNLGNAFALKAREVLGSADVRGFEAQVKGSLPSLAIAENMTAGRVGTQVLQAIELPQLPDKNDSEASFKRKVNLSRERLRTNLDILWGAPIAEDVAPTGGLVGTSKTTKF